MKWVCIVSFVILLVQVCPVPATSHLNGGDGYIGCFQDNQYNRLLTQYISNGIPTPEHCVEKCKERGYFYAGVESGGECYCGNSGTYLGNPVGEQVCNTRCYAARHKICGGNGMISVYSTNGVLQCRSKEVIKFVPATSYLGCFREDGNTHLLPDYYEIYSSLTPEYCIDFCSNHGHRFAGVKAGQECHCGRLDRFYENRVDDGYCTTPCVGEKSKHCGGNGMISIYSMNGIEMSHNNEVYVNWQRNEDMFREGSTHSQFFSPYFYLNNYRFSIDIERVFVNYPNRLEVYLYCHDQNINNYCINKFKFTFSILRNNGYPFTKEIILPFDGSKPSLGWGNFMDVNELMTRGGYIENSYVHFEAYVKLEI